MKIYKKTTAIIAGFLFTLPFIYLLFLSGTNDWAYPALLPSGYNLKIWKEALQYNNGIVSGFFISLLIATIVAFIATLLGFLISRTIALQEKRKLLLFTCYFPLALSPVIFSLLVNYFFIRVGLSGHITGIIIAQLMIALPFSILLLNSFWTAQIKALEAVSSTLGAGFKHTFLKVLLPTAKPQLLVCFIQTFLISWFEYGLTTIIGVGKVKTLTLKVYQYISEANIYYAAISSCIIVMPIVILIWICRKLIYNKTA